MIHLFFAGDIFGPEDIPGLLLVILIKGVPYILVTVVLIMLLYDAVKRKLRRSTKIFIVLTIIGLILNAVSDRFM